MCNKCDNITHEDINDVCETYIKLIRVIRDDYAKFVRVINRYTQSDDEKREKVRVLVRAGAKKYYYQNREKVIKNVQRNNKLKKELRNTIIEV